MASKTKMQTEEKNETKRHRSKRRNCLRKCFHSFKHVIDHVNICFILLISFQTCSHSLNNANSLHCFTWFLLYYLLHLLRSDPFAALISLQPYKFFIGVYEFFENYPQRKECFIM